MFKNKKILIIGGTGTIGEALVDKILPHKPHTIRIYSRDEHKQFVMQQKLRQHKNIRFLIGDVRDKERLDRAMNEINIIFDLAALKHVPSCEYNPFEAVKTNVMGTQNVIECAIANKVEKVIYTSSDKAVSPTNTMGATKLLAERIIAAADYAKGGSKTIFAAVRFGNVMGSRGSVIPLWQEQIKQSRKITITEPDMTRFMMSIPQAVDLVLKAYEHAKGGEVFVLKMPVMKLGDLGRAVIESTCENISISLDEVKLEKIGLRPGEKMYEELMTEAESLSAIEYDEMFAILPHHKMEHIDTYGVKRAELGEYSSHNNTLLTVEKIKDMLIEAKVI